MQTFVVSYSLLALHINKLMVVVLVFQLTAMLYLKKKKYRKGLRDGAQAFQPKLRPSLPADYVTAQQHM